MRRRHPNAILVDLGLGSRREELLALAKAEGVADAVFLAGSVGDVSDWLRRAEVFVHPARWEGFGLALLEAMLAGLPIVASEVSSIPEIVEDAATGLLVPPNDVGQLAGAINVLLDDPVLARSYGAAGLERARALFSVGAMAERTLAVYRDALGSSPAASRTTASAHDPTE